jgi:hypothetical protein
MNFALAKRSPYVQNAIPRGGDRLFGMLAGTWRIQRSIDPEGMLDGTARFSVRDDGWLHYAETGELAIHGGQFTARRSYLFEPKEDGFSVWFDAEPLRLFHTIVLDGAEGGVRTGAAEHLCRNDLYLSSYSLEPDGRFTIRHRVTGPNKDYTVTTLYTRIPEAA